MNNLFIDIETYSDVSIDHGVYAYSASNNFRVLLFSYSIDGAPVVCVDIKHGEKLPTDVYKALWDRWVIKHAFNANFERVCLSRWYNLQLDATQWHCTMIECAYNGLPMSLKAAGEALAIQHKKLDEGKELIKKFSIPNAKPTLYDGEDWERFKVYNIRDVEAEMQIHNALPFEVPQQVWTEYALDQQINDAGVLIDYQLVDQAVRINTEIMAAYMKELRELTGLDNPKSVAQLKEWLERRGIHTDSLDKAAIKELMKTAPDDVKKVLDLKLKVSKSSVKKYEAMIDLRGKDDRVRGCFQFYGSHTGRYAGRNIQLQNLPANHIADLEGVRSLVRNGDIDLLECLYDNIPQILSELIRTTIIAPTKFIVADFSAIEARVIAWLAKEEWRTEVFRNGGDIYCASASAMFKVPVVKNGVNGHLRQKGKIAELALGYGGSVGALKAFGAVELGIPEDELKDIVDKWRQASPNIVSLWYDIDKKCKNVISNKGVKQTFSVGNGSVLIGYKNGCLIIKLPSSRFLVYQNPGIGTNKFGSESITYYGVNSVRKWEKIETMGARLTENIVQAIARDLLAEAMLRLTAKGFKIVAHVHDEVIIEATEEQTLDEAVSLMCELPIWAEGMVLNAAGFESKFYKKD